MNSQQNLEIGIATSAAQHETPRPEDLHFIEQINQILRTETPQNALVSIYEYGYDNLNTPLSEIGLNIRAINNIIKGFIERKEFDEGIEIVKSISNILVFGLDNEEVFDKYINLLKLFNFKLLRISLRWDKIASGNGHTPNPTEINKYREKCEKLISNGIEPIVTFSHFETMSLDINSERFLEIFENVANLVLDRLVSTGVKYWIAFNEPAVHSGAVNLGFWGKGKQTIGNLKNHFSTLGRFGELSKIFYQKAQVKAERYKVPVKIIANFNVALFDPGTSPTILDKFFVWLADKIDKDAQINPFMFEDGTYAFDILALNPYQIYDFAWVNKLLRTNIPKFLKNMYVGAFLAGEGAYPDEIIDFDGIVENTSNPDFQDPNEVRYGSKGEILYPKAIGSVIRKIMTDFKITQFVVTESGADIYSKSKEGIENKVWYLENVMKQLEQLRSEGISIPFALIWTLIRMWEIVGPKGGGIGEWDFGILAEPLHTDDIAKLLMEYLDMDSFKAKVVAKKIVSDGNTPIRIYEGMVENLGTIFGTAEISATQLKEALVPNAEGGNVLVNILQLILLRDYYQIKGDESSYAFMSQIVDDALHTYNVEDKTLELSVPEA